MSLFVYEDIEKERDRADEKHRYFGNSVEDKDPDWDLWLPILTEELGEVARAICDEDPLEHLREELIQVAAMAAAWADSCDREIAQNKKGQERLVYARWASYSGPPIAFDSRRDPAQ